MTAWRGPCALFFALIPLPALAANEPYEYAAEHLPEVAMDNRANSLPLWRGGAEPASGWQFTGQAGFARTSSGELVLQGPMFSTAASRRLNERQSVRVFGFFDQLDFSGGNDRRPLLVLFAQPPLSLPARALFTDLRGTCRNTGAGLAFNLRGGAGWLGARQWVLGALYERVTLSRYRVNYQVLEGPSAGATGLVDYSADYGYFTPFAGLALAHDFDRWILSPHVLFTLPVPRHGIQGRITGPGFDLSGDTERAGNGTHFGDESLTLGLDLTYKPWDLSVDAGGVLSQALTEGVRHEGVDRNWVLSVYQRF